ncbi:hypothetical protein ACLOJK_028994 [Asimina triloba]
MATVAHCLDESKSFFDRSYNRVVYILTLATSSLLLMVILIIFSPYRRHSCNVFLKGALWASQVLPFSIISHTLGLMQSAPYGNETYAIWAVLFLLIHGISDSKVYGFQEKQQGKIQMLQEVVLLYLASWLMYLHHTEGKLSGPLLMILGIAFVKFLFRLTQTSFAYSPSCRYFGLRRRMKLVADFMTFEHELSRSPTHASMKGYKYLVKGEENIVEHMANKDYCRNNLEKINENVVTVERIWQCKGALLGGSQGEKLKDKCLSFAFFRLLVMRCRGFPFQKKHYSKNWDLVRGGLLSEQNKHERAFRVIEDELSFLYDYFYTQYPLLFSDGKFFTSRTAIYAFLEFAQFLAGVWIVTALLISGDYSLTDFSLRDHEFCSDDCDDRIWSNFRYYACNHLPEGIHFCGTCIFVGVYVVLQIWLLLTIVFSNWAKVWLLCEYVERPWWQGNPTLGSFIGFVCGWKRIPLKPWRRKMGQYFLLSSYKYRPVPYFLVSAFIEVPKRGQESPRDKILEPWVKSAVLDFLMENGHQLTNGLSFLQRNNIDSQLSWACRLKSLTDSILVWHVATSFCFMEQKYGKTFKGRESAADVQQKREVVECLSGYCGYLVAFVPALLPDPADVTEVIFDKAILDARKFMESCKSPCEIYHKLKDLGKKRDGEEVVVMELKALENKTDVDGDDLGELDEKLDEEVVVVVMGARLGMQLVSAAADEAQLWKVLVDFWAETMLFLAPSNNVMAHVESLANGGEFITHLWALLTHIGGFRKNSEFQLGDEIPNLVTAYVQDTPTSAPQPMDETTNPVLHVEKFSHLLSSDADGLAVHLLDSVLVDLSKSEASTDCDLAVAREDLKRYLMFGGFSGISSAVVLMHRQSYVHTLSVKDVQRSFYKCILVLSPNCVSVHTTIPKQDFSPDLPFMNEFLNDYGIALGQLTPHSWRSPLWNTELVKCFRSIPDFLFSTVCLPSMFNFSNHLFSFAEVVFAQTSPIVTSVSGGFSVCTFAYGQTGTGKTFTMEESPGNRVYNEKIRDLLLDHSKQPAKKYYSETYWWE